MLSLCRGLQTLRADICKSTNQTKEMIRTEIEYLIILIHCYLNSQHNECLKRMLAGVRGTFRHTDQADQRS